MKTVGLSMAILLLLSAAEAVVKISANGRTRSRPSFVVFFADDFGYGDLSSYGHPTQEYGHIDHMADNGVRFTQWYSAESLCTPSRAAMLTGRMPTRMGFPHSVFSPSSSNALPSTDPTVAEMLEPLGYRRGMVGKYHLGINNVSSSDGTLLPAYRGFDYVGHILPFSNHWLCDESGRHSPKPGVDPKVDAKRNSVCFVYHNTTIVQSPIDHQHLTQTLVDDAISFIANASAAGDDFYLYFAFPQCHVSMFTNTSFTNTSRNGIFGDQIREMDWAVGQVLDALKEHNRANDTLAFFTSDHGPHVELCKEGGTAGYLRGGKGDSSWEGGLRVPGIAYWPGTVQPKLSSAVVSTMDVTATILDLAGTSFPSGKIYDGKSLVPLLMNQTEDTPHEALFHYCGDTLMAVRYKQYKLRYYTEQLPFDNYSAVHCQHGWADGEFFQGGWACHGGSVTTENPPLLFDVEMDMREEYSLIGAPHWDRHLARLNAQPDAPQLPYYSDIGYKHRHTPSSNDPTCPTSPIFYNGTVGHGYQSHAVSGTQEEMLAACMQSCCQTEGCCAAILQNYSENHGEPVGSCEVGKPCCWQAKDCSPSTFQPQPNGTTVVVQGGFPPSPYDDIVDKIQSIVADHLKKMVREVLPGFSNAKFQPCCGDEEPCTCNYPGKAP